MIRKITGLLSLSVLSIMVILATTKMVVYEHHCNCKQEVFLTFSEEVNCCKDVTECHIPNSFSCCNNGSAHSHDNTCSLNNMKDCCGSTAIYVINKQDLDIPTLKIYLKPFAKALRILIIPGPNQESELTFCCEFDPPFKKIIQKEILLLSQPQNAPPVLI